MENPKTKKEVTRIIFQVDDRDPQFCATTMCFAVQFFRLHNYDPEGTFEQFVVDNIGYYWPKDSKTGEINKAITKVEKKRMSTVSLYGITFSSTLFSAWVQRLDDLTKSSVVALKVSHAIIYGN
ncbi:hypothetical protein L6452_08825 [Arctium lappa]|uniref:Uncharacterized protein n=1 Tax=Arctium lappa TaxID=4217 RepID=A0ACB9DIA0_ARCLA|nr:hypothetical protein L6452_08825 [Arctium lappa]